MNVFELVAKLSLDHSEYDEGLGESEKEGKSFLGKVGAGFKTAGKVALAGIAAASTGVAALTKQAVAGYGEYEQLVGGIDKLFGEESSDKLQQYAANAYKTAGMSANAYMQNVTGFSASLINSLDGDTQKAADIADMAMRDIADNANTFGKYTAEELAGVYQALAKGQYQTLDNLNLGYGGSKEGMQSLIDKANELRKAQGLTADLTIDSYADIVQAIHEVQNEMNITGATEKEASTTIQGSLTAMKAAWSNLVVGLADDNADIEELIDNLVTTIIGENGEGGVLNNILPAVERAFEGIVTLVTTAAPTIIPIIVDIINRNLPQLINAGIQVLIALITGIGRALPELIRAIPQIIKAIVDGLKEAWPDIKAAGLDLIDMLGQGIEDAFWWLVDLGSQVIDKIAEGISNAWSGLVNWFNGLWSGLFGNRSVNVDVNGSTNIDGSHAGGLDYVPFNGYLAELHQGEAVLTSREAGEWRRGGTRVQEDNRPIYIVSQIMLDGKKVGESVKRYERNLGRATG